MEKQFIKTFGEFINEGNVTIISEKYEDYVTEDKITSKEELYSHIVKNIGPAFGKFIKSKLSIDHKFEGADNKRGYIEIESKPFTGKDLGIFKFGIKEMWINTFGGGQPRFKTEDEQFKFQQYMWMRLHYSYNHGAEHVNKQGSNGCNLFIPGEDTDAIYYDILNDKFLTSSEGEKI